MAAAVGGSGGGGGAGKVAAAGLGLAAAAGGQPRLSLQHFVWRSQALSLYRACWRASSLRVAPYLGANERRELREFARDSFRAMRYVHLCRRVVWCRVVSCRVVSCRVVSCRVSLL